MRKSVVNQSELAFTAYINGIIAGTIAPPSENPTANTTLAGTTGFPMLVQAFHQVYAATNPNPGQSVNPENVTLPYILFQAGKPDQLVWDCGIYELPMMAFVETQVDDEQLPSGAADIHHARIEALRDCLEDFSNISTAVNYPNNQATVPYYTLSAILFLDEMEELKDRRFITQLTYNITACPADPFGDT